MDSNFKPINKTPTIILRWSQYNILENAFHDWITRSKFIDLKKNLKLFEETKEYENFEYKRKLDSKINIVEEFKLIKQKKSNLSRWEREEVIKEFNKEYILKK